MSSPRVLIIGAGSRGNTYARAIASSTSGRVVGVCEPDRVKRDLFTTKYLTSLSASSELIFPSWESLLSPAVVPTVQSSVDGVCICTLDSTHVQILTSLRPTYPNLHILCEKPIAETLSDCRAIYSSLISGPPVVFAVGHVLRYSPHNLLLQQLLPQIGDIININHTEPVGYWHFAHSYVRGNWRRGAPSLLTKCCHDIDLLLMLLSSDGLPARVSSHGSLVGFKKNKKPETAGEAKRCTECPVEQECIYSARRIYIEDQLRKKRNQGGWPNKILVPDIEDAGSIEAAATKLEEAIRMGPYGRCVWECDNDVVDNQVVVLEWDGERAKTATLTMIAHTEAICERFTQIYGTKGQLTADSKTIRVYEFQKGEGRVYNPELDIESGHGGGDAGLAKAFIDAIEAVSSGAQVEEAQRRFIKCTVEEALRSHEVVFWAEDARVKRRVLEWEEWTTN